MSKNKIGPYIFIATLLLIFFFILGVRLGQRVEKINTQTQKVPTVTPFEKPLVFSTFANNFCALKFLYPQTLTITEQTTGSAKLINKDKREDMVLSCIKNDDLNTILKDPSIATSEVSFKNKKIIVKQTTGSKSAIFYIFSLINPQNGKNIQVKIESSLYPLFENTLQFVSK